jgi:hypothetical protein
MLFLVSLAAVVFIDNFFCLVDMDNNDGMMIHQPMEDDDTFDANVHEHQSILTCLLKMDAAELKEGPRHRGSKRGKNVVVLRLGDATRNICAPKVAQRGGTPQTLVPELLLDGVWGRRREMLLHVMAPTQLFLFRHN